MLDMLLPANTARKHGHGHGHAHSHGHGDSTSPEAESPSSPTIQGSFLVQMPLSIIGSVLRRQTPSPAPMTAVLPRAPDHDMPKASTQPTPSRPASSGSSSATIDSQPKKRTPRSKTSYICARPPRPVDTRSKLYIRPKVLLQLHQVIASQRPKPTYEVVPFSLLPPRSTRQVARAFHCKDKLGSNDLLIVKAEEYESKEDEHKSDDDRWGSRDVVGIICPAKSDKDVTVICMDAGRSRWEVTDMPNGGFEFNTTDGHGLSLKARWVLKPGLSRRTSGISVSTPVSPTFPTEQEDRKYTFSTIRANSRRHPIIATMTRSRIDVMDSYTMPSALSPPTPGSLSYIQTPALTPTSIDESSFFSNHNMPITTDDALRQFILVSGVWVATKGFDSSNASTQTPTPSLETSATFRTCNNRTLSMSFLDSPRSASPSSTSDENRRSFPRLLRTSRERLPRSTSFTAPSAPDVPNQATRNASPVQTRSRRANSTGNANLHSMSGSMRKRYGLAFENQALPESEEERQSKRSAELLRIKELALSPTSERSSSEVPENESVRPVVPFPIVTRPSSDVPAPAMSAPLLSPSTRDSERARKTQSTYNPITTAGMWDSGVTEHPGLKSRPTSMFVINEKKKKQERKRERSKSKEGKKYEKERLREEKDSTSLKKHGEWHKIKSSFKTLFRKEKT